MKVPPVLVFPLVVYYKVDRLLTGLTCLTAQQSVWAARWYLNKISLVTIGLFHGL